MSYSPNWRRLNRIKDLPSSQQFYNDLHLHTSALCIRITTLCRWLFELQPFFFHFVKTSRCQLHFHAIICSFLWIFKFYTDFLPTCPKLTSSTCIYTLQISLKSMPLNTTNRCLWWRKKINMKFTHLKKNQVKYFCVYYNYKNKYRHNIMKHLKKFYNCLNETNHGIQLYIY